MLKTEQIKQFVNNALNTNESHNELRRANILTEEKQGKNARKGIIIETILQKSGESGL